MAHCLFFVFVFSFNRKLVDPRSAIGLESGELSAKCVQKTSLGAIYAATIASVMCIQILETCDFRTVLASHLRRFYDGQFELTVYLQYFDVKTRVKTAISADNGI